MSEARTSEDTASGDSHAFTFRISPTRTVILLVLCVFAAEVSVMFAIPLLPNYSKAIVAVIDSSFLIFLIFPSFFFLVFRPMKRYMEILCVAKSGLEKSYSALEERNNRQIEELKDTYTMWDGCLNSIPDMVAIIDREHRILKANRVVEKEFPCVSILGMKCHELFHGTTEAPPDDCPIYKTFEFEQPIHREVFLKNMGNRWFDFSYHPVPTSDGRIDRIVHIIRDITERKHYEAELETTTRLYSSLVENVNDMVFFLDQDGNVIY